MIGVIAFPYHDWRKGQLESVRTRDGHLLRAIGAHGAIGQLLVVDRPVSLGERAVTRQPPAVTGQHVDHRSLGWGWRATLTRVAAKTTVLDVATPGTLGPARDPRGWWFDVFEDRHVHDAMDWAMERLSLEHPAGVAWTPAVAGALDHVAPRPLVFDSLDNWITHPVLRRHADRARNAYRRVLPAADAVLVPSAATRRELEPYAPHAEVVPNGVDLDRFARAAPRPADLPPGPILGYLGKLGIRLDVPLACSTAAQLPDVSLVFVGPELESDLLAPLRVLQNVHLIGDRRAEDVPAYLAAFDVAWIPHRVGEGETGGDLMKKYEYWAAGRQVVTTPLADLDDWSSQLHVVSDATEAAATIRGLLDGSIPPTPTVVPPERTWPAIAEIVLRALGANVPTDQAPLRTTS